MNTIPPSSITKVTCPKCRIAPGGDAAFSDPNCGLCEGCGMVTKYIANLYETRRMSGEYRGVTP